MSEITEAACDNFYDMLECREFVNAASETIFEFLKKKSMIVPFSDYLKRLVYIKAGMRENFSSVPDEVYQQCIMNAFKNTGTPPSLRPSSTRLSTVVKNWLSAVTVSRETVFLIGFGLKLSAIEVNDLLTKAIHESKIYYRNPYEVIYSYCYDNKLPYSRMVELANSYSRCVNQLARNAEEGNTINVMSAVKKATNDEELLDIIKQYRLDPTYISSRTARKEFDYLYEQCCEIVAKYKGRDDNWQVEALPVKDKKGSSILKKLKGEKNVTASEIEKELNTGTPIDENGNLMKFSDSALCNTFRQKRMSRKHINDILTNKVAVDRFDLITMKFFIISEQDADMKNNARWWHFVEECNKMLDSCSMGQFYNANPYDCFLQMCMLTDVPMATYDEILEMSYEN